ncbi:MAG: NADPH-dependent F420 reductase, partial [Gemmatimonadales bacterium]
VGILGTGQVGQSLARGFEKYGHEVRLGSRDPARPYADAARFGEIAVLCTRWDGTENALRLAGPDNLAGKVVIDVTNPLGAGSSGPALAVGFDDSGGEHVQRWLPGSRVVKALNIINQAYMVDPQFPGGPPDMFIAGNDAAAKRTVTEILRQFGWPVMDIGGIEGARLLESLAMLWITIGVRRGRWDHAWKLLREEDA